MRTPTLAPCCSSANFSACLTFQDKKKKTEGSQVSALWRDELLVMLGCCSGSCQLQA